jgi:hypothetical protein
MTAIILLEISCKKAVSFSLSYSMHTSFGGGAIGSTIFGTASSMLDFRIHDLRSKSIHFLTILKRGLGTSSRFNMPLIRGARTVYS